MASNLVKKKRYYIAKIGFEIFPSVLRIPEKKVLKKMIELLSFQISQDWHRDGVILNELEISNTSNQWIFQGSGPQIWRISESYQDHVFIR